MEATESTSLLPSSPPSQDGSPSSNRPQLRSHSRGESFVPEFILTSVEKVEDFAHDVTEHVEEMAHDLTTFEIFNLEEHLPEGMDHVPPEYDPLSNELVTDLEDLAEAPDLELIEEIIHPPDPMAASAEKLGVLPLAIMVFYSVSGGPFGCETSVRAGGNFFALLGFLVMPFVWSLQEALMTAELGTVFPEASGGVAWVEEAFGTNMGWMTGYLGWIAGATDNAIYPVLFLDYLLQVVGGGAGTIPSGIRFVLLSTTSIALGYINWLGLPVVGKLSLSICLVAMSPFIILTVVGAFKVKPSRWFEWPQEDIGTIEAVTDDDIGGGFFPGVSIGGVLWRPFLNNLFWNLNSFDAGASFAGDIDDPGKVFPRAMKLAFVMVMACYFVPLLVAIGSTDARQHQWVDGFLARVTGEVVGPWLGAWTVLAAGISNIALFQAELSADAFQLMGMADRGHLPKLFSHRSKHGTPTYGIMLGTLVIVIMGVSNLDQLIEMLNFNYAIALLMEYAAFIKLRICQPDLERPFRIPLNTFGCILFFTPTILVTLLLLSLATYTTLLFCVGCNIVGMLVFLAKQRSELQRHETMLSVKEPQSEAGHTAPDGDSGSTPHSSTQRKRAARMHR